MHAVFLGASKGIGYNTLLNLLSNGQWTATALLRKPDVMQADEKVQKYLDAGSLKIVKGNATVSSDVAKLFTKNVDVVVTSVGAAPKFSWTGIAMDQPTICTDSTVALLDAISSLPKVPRIIAVSSMGMGDNHQYMPWILRVIYPWMLDKPHKDKEGLEYLLQRSSSSLTAPEAHYPPEWIISKSHIEETKADFIPEVIIVRPALLTSDGPATGKYRVDPTLYTYQTNRADVGKFIADECMPGNDKWVNTLPVIGN